VSPETIDGFVNAWLWAVDKVDTYGPGVVFVATVVATWWALNRAARIVRRLRHRRGIRRLEHYANHPANARKEGK
jgi:hypothetical protein